MTWSVPACLQEHQVMLSSSDCRFPSVQDNSWTANTPYPPLSTHCDSLAHILIKNILFCCYCMYTNISYLAGTSAQTHGIAVPQHFQLDKISGAKCNIPKSSLFHCLKWFQELFFIQLQWLVAGEHMRIILIVLKDNYKFLTSVAVKSWKPATNGKSPVEFSLNFTPPT